MDLNPSTGGNSLKLNTKLKLDIKSKPVIFAITIVVIGLLAGGFWYWSKRKVEILLPQSAEQQKEKLQENVGDGLGAAIFEKSQNPIVDKLSETNPFGKTPINPLKAIYTNPFE